MFKLYLSIFFVVLLVPFFVQAQNQVWYFPIQGDENRNQYKTFNQYIDKSFYVGREKLFPTKFTGYHVGDDLEISSNEENQNVPVYAISDGKITFAGPVGGYGGLILFNIANDSHTALYGHISLSSLKVKAGDTVKAGQELAYLGKGFSNETAGERKHLHFAIYNGKSIYYRGYESSEAAVQSKWVDPGAYLKQKGAVELNDQSSASNTQKDNSQNVDINRSQIVSDTKATQPDQNFSTEPENKGFLVNLLGQLKNLIKNFFN